MPQSRVELYTSIVPSPRQTAFQEGGFHVFFHYGINTFTNREWGDGKAPAQMFSPTRQNTDQWIEAVSAAGAKGVILTAKHHDGFCLWPTETTEYCVRNSPYRSGYGDVVREVSDSCKKYGLKFGLYLSLWDRNCPLYGTPEYNDFYIRQLTELLTGYGEIFCVWLDGACGAKMDGKEPYPYDFERVYQTVRGLQPNAVISNCGPDIRWVGNESGRARKSEWNVVPAFSCETQNIASHSQQTDAQDMKQQASDSHLEDLGSRAFLVTTIPLCGIPRRWMYPSGPAGFTIKRRIAACAAWRTSCASTMALWAATACSCLTFRRIQRACCTKRMSGG